MSCIEDAQYDNIEISLSIIYLELKLFSINCKILFKVNLGRNKIREQNC